MNPLLEAALAYAEAGFSIFPLVRGEKYPFTKNGVKDATNNKEQITVWWTENPSANIGFPLGKINGLIGLDIDYKDGCDPEFLKKIPPTVIIKSPNGGHHAYFRYANGPISNNLKIEKGVTIRSDGYYLVAPPSILSSGKKYEPIGRDIYCGDILDIPEWFKEIGEKTLEEKKPFKMPAEILDGTGREDNLFKLASSLRSKGFNENEIMAALQSANNRCVPPKPVQDLIRITNSVLKYKAGNSTIEASDSSGFNFPDKKPKRKIPGTIENIKSLLGNLKIVIRYNVMSKEEEILIPNEFFSMDNRANASLATIISWCNRLGIQTGNLSEILSKIADSNPYNPAATWIESVPWDGVDRLIPLCETIKSKTELKNILIKKWMLSAIAALYEPNGVSAHGVLVFRGEQYIGKTMWFKKLALPELNVLKDGAILYPDNKDSVFQVVSKWLVELGELDATFRKADIAQLKAFITKDQDVLRRAYARKESNYARRTVFFASVNEHHFLNDPTGNRRFWTIDCDEIDYAHSINMQQAWAQIRILYAKGDSWYLEPSENEALNKSNESFQQTDPIEEMIRDLFNWDSESREYLSATEICGKIGITKPNNNDCRKVGSAMRKIVKDKPKTLNGLARFATPYLKNSVIP